MHTGVIRPRDVNIGNRQLIEAEMKGCQVRDVLDFRRKRYVIFTNFIQDV